MEEKEKRKQIAKISIFITSIFVIFLSVTYAFINQTLTGTKRQVITAGNLSLELQEDENNLTITDAMPMYDEVGMIGEAFTFRLVNKIDVRTNYIVKLEKIIVADPLDESLVKYGLTKDEEVTIDFISNIEENTIDSGTISGNQTISYSLRLWIDSSVEEESLISRKSLSYKLNIEASQNTEVVQLPPATNTSELVSDSTDLGESCKTYNDGVNTFLVGQCQNNYVWYSGKLWRVVLKNNETGSVKMITDNSITTISYNDSGNTNFENSYVDQWLNQEFLPTLHDYQDYLVADSMWDISNGNPSTKPDGSLIINRTVGLLNAYEYHTTYNLSDGLATFSTGYLNKDTWFWLINSNPSSSVYLVYSSGFITTSPLTNDDDIFGVRPVVNLKSNIQIISGNGSISEPYKLAGDEQEAIGGTTLLNTRYSGEYVKFNDQLYRIVDVENNLTKITAVNVVANKTFDEYEIANFASASIKTYLEEYYQELNVATKSLVELNTVWYLGKVGINESYKKSICDKLNIQTNTKNCTKTSSIVRTNIGLSRVGEMFASQISKSTKVRLWLLTAHDEKGISVIDSDGKITNGGLSKYNYFGVRPSIYLKQTVVISKNNAGDGTYDNPYDIELGA